ncbi:MAG TPA: FAD-dependent oxidoreductase [Acidimicrobiia bacterium]|nr:FAD-dependent oxidoreductase [Acidimicrobiia bacterium]
MADRLVVVGGDAAGMSAASQARRLRPDLEIVALERSGHVSYSACGEPYYVGGLVTDLDRLVARTPSEFAERNIEVRLHYEVKEIDLDRRVVVAYSLQGKDTLTLGFDQLMYSTGSAPLRPPDVSGIDHPNVYGLRTLEDAVLLRSEAVRGEGSAVIVGGGYIGIEVAEALVDRGWRVTMVTSGDHVLERTLDDQMGSLADRAVRNYGVELLTQSRVTHIKHQDGRQLVGGDSFAVDSDLTVIGLGAGPEVALARAAGIDLGPTGAVAVDDRQATNVEGVWSAGDCAEARNRITGRPINILLGTVANKTGRIAGTNIGGGEAHFPGVLGTAITKIGTTEIARTGLKVEEARVAGFTPVVGIARGTTTAGYWPEAEPVTVMVIADRDQGRLLGGQVVGGRGAGKRIDVLATAIWTGMTAEELAWVDLSYAPPFSGVWDIIHIAARRAAGA